MLLYKAGKAVPGPKANTMFASLLLSILFLSPSTCHLSLRLSPPCTDQVLEVNEIREGL